jgi:hypothetical protein
MCLSSPPPIFVVAAIAAVVFFTMTALILSLPWWGVTPPEKELTRWSVVILQRGKWPDTLERWKLRPTRGLSASHREV